jgi:hypothetical protein
MLYKHSLGKRYTKFYIGKRYCRLRSTLNPLALPDFLNPYRPNTCFSLLLSSADAAAVSPGRSGLARRAAQAGRKPAAGRGCERWPQWPSACALRVDGVVPLTRGGPRQLLTILSAGPRHDAARHSPVAADGRQRGRASS